MLKTIKITEISVVDKQILATAINEYGKMVQNRYAQDPKKSDHLLLLSICQNSYHDMVQHLNGSKILQYTEKEKLLPSRSATLFVHTALVSINALQYYEKEGGPLPLFVNSRVNVLIQKLHQQIMNYR